MSKKMGTAETTRILEEAGCESNYSPTGQDGDDTHYWNCSDKDLTGVDLTDADLTHAERRGANLDGTTGRP